MTVRRRPLGRTGLMVSEVGHGLWGMGSWSDADDERSATSLRLSVAEGCNFFDSAATYGDGRSDSLLGDLLRSEHQHTLVAASKIPPANGKFPGAAITDDYEDLFPVDYAIAMTRRILKTIGIKTIPLLQLHVWDDRWADAPAFAETIRELKGQGLIDHLGISLNRWEPSNGVRAVESGLIDTVQVVYNIFTQAPEDELFPACRRNNVGVIARVPLDEGSLAGNISAATNFPSEDWRSGYFNPRNLQQTTERVDRIRGILPNEMSLSELAIRFVLSNADVSTVIVGMRTEEHVRQNLGSGSLSALPASLVQQLRAHRWDRRALP
jgi:aryl-alcohol dehydrogenase-like predicted oxidoreductase